MSTSYFDRLPQSVQAIVIDGLDAEMQAGLERLDEERKKNNTDTELQTSIEGDVKRASALRNKFSPAK